MIRRFFKQKEKSVNRPKKPPIVNTLTAITPDTIAYPALLTPVIDRSFGYEMEIIRISDISHGYSKNQRWSLDMELCKVGDGFIHHGHNFNLLFSLSKQSGGKTIWSNLDSKKLFGFGSNTIEVLTINSGNTSNTRSVIISFIYANGYDDGTNGTVLFPTSLMSEGDISIDDTYTVVCVKRSNELTYAVCNLQSPAIDSYKTDSQLRTIFGANSSGRFDYVTVSKSGNYIVANYVESDNGKNGKWVFNKDWTPVMHGGNQVNLGNHSHMDFAYANGREVMTKMGVPGFVDLLTGAQTTVIPTSMLDNAWGNNHEGGHSSGTGETGWGLFSFHSVRTATQISSNSPRFYPYIVYAKLDGSNQYRRFVHARRAEIGANYANEAKGCISRDGRYVMYDSNWDMANTDAKAFIARRK